MSAPIDPLKCPICGDSKFAIKLREDATKELTGRFNFAADRIAALEDIIGFAEAHYPFGYPELMEKIQAYRATFSLA